MLRKITFTGVDERTDIEELVRLQRDYPIVEFGFLAVAPHPFTGNRYFDPDMLYSYVEKGLTMSLHVCGNLNDLVLQTGDWEDIKSYVGDYFTLFQRIQLNVSKRHEIEWRLSVPIGVDEIIIQQRNADNIPIFRYVVEENAKGNDIGRFSVLLDESGGKGIYNPNIKTFRYPYVGYAGGLNPTIVNEFVHRLDSDSNVVDYWIDMEGCLRTDEDWFSVDICRKVCERLVEYNWNQ